jgi:hypothetical protein
MEADAKLEAERAAQLEEARLAALEVENEKEQERLELAFERELEHSGKLINLTTRRAKAELRIKKDLLREENRARVAQARLEVRAAQQTIRLRQATAQTSVQILQTLLGKNKTVARALFLVEKGLAIARTIQNTAAAATKAIAELGPIAGPPAAAAITAFGAAQVSLIAATALTGVGSVGGGGAASIGAGGFTPQGGTGGGDFGGDFGGDQQFGGGGTPATDQGVVQLIFPSLFGITPEAVDALADALREASENRDVIVVSGQGRNAELLNGTNG